jgi:hypothetical protein
LRAEAGPQGTTDTCGYYEEGSQVRVGMGYYGRNPSSCSYTTSRVVLTKTLKKPAS